MIIKKILNNNFILVNGKNGEEMVAMGKGSAFPTKWGMTSV